MLAPSPLSLWPHGWGVWYQYLGLGEDQAAWKQLDQIRLVRKPDKI